MTFKSLYFLLFVSLILLIPFGLNAENHATSQMENQVRNYEVFVSRQEADLRSCRETYVNQC